MAKKPANLIYGVDDKPPLWALLLLGLQHIFIITVYFIFPVIIVNYIGGTSEQAATMIKMSMIAIGVTTIIQALSKGPIGSGYLCPSGNGPAYLSATLMAAKTGGLSLVCGMTVVGGIIEAIYSPLIARLRALFPPEVAGLVVVMVGVELIPLGIKRMFGLGHFADIINHNYLIIGLTTYVVMVGFNTWGKGKLRLYPILIGMAVGYIMSYLFGVLTPSDFKEVSQAPFIALPKIGSFGWSFDLTLVLPFFIATLCSSLKDIGDITTCQKISDSEWKRPDMQIISKGIRADAIGDIFSGIIGGLGQTTSSSNIGLSLATGATSRTIAYVTGAILCGLAFFPKMATVFVIMPKPVMGAILIFCANFMILSGIQIITSRMLDVRKIFVIGTSLCFGLSVIFFPKAYSHLPDLLKPIFSSALSLSTIMVVILNVIFRIGITKRREVTFEPQAEALTEIPNLMASQGATWGARSEVIQRATVAMSEFMESAIGLHLSDGPITATLNFDEFNLEVIFTYHGKLMDFNSEYPTKVELLEDETAVFRFSSNIIRENVDKIKTAQQNGDCKITFHFDH